MSQDNKSNGQNPYICQFCGHNNAERSRPHFGGKPPRKPDANERYVSGKSERTISYKCECCGELNIIKS